MRQHIEKKKKREEMKYFAMILQNDRSTIASLYTATNNDTYIVVYGIAGQ